MRLFTALLPILLPYLATASFFKSGQQVLSSELSVPGDNPLEFCASTSDYTLSITKVDLEPNPPKPGKTLTIKAEGTFETEVVKGAYINVSVKYGLIKLISLKLDLCDQMSNVDESCPLDGKKVITKQVDIPSEVPPGSYTVLADVYNADDKQITCLTAHITF